MNKNKHSNNNAINKNAINKNAINKDAISISMDLENLQQKYSNLLIKYKKSVTDYINYLNLEAKKPCANYNANSTNIDQKCYDYIWEKAGCKTTGVANASTSWAQSQTLNGLIEDTFNWATETDSTHRQGCYGTSTDYSTATQPNYNINAEQFVNIQGMAYMGTGTAGNSSANTLQTCEAECSSNPKCTGATFISGKCSLRTGDSQIIPAASNSYAIIPKGKQLLMNMENLNQQLLNVNAQITKKIKVGQPIYDKYEVLNNEKSQELIKNYKELEIERENIRKLLDQYETLDTTENKNQMQITKNYYSYILLFILAVAVIFLLAKITISGSTQPTPNIQYGGELNKNTYYIIFIMIILIFGINYLTKHFHL